MNKMYLRAILLVVLVGVVLAQNLNFEKNERSVRSLSAGKEVEDMVSRFVRNTGIQGRYYGLFDLLYDIFYGILDFFLG